MPWTIQEIKHSTRIPINFLSRFNWFYSPDQIQKRRNSLIGYDNAVSCNYVIIMCGCKRLLFVISRPYSSFRFQNFLFYSTRSRRVFKKEVRSFKKKINISNWNFNSKIMTKNFCNFSNFLRYVYVLTRGPNKQKFFDNQDISSWPLITALVGSRWFSSRHLWAVCAEAIASQRIPLFW